MKFIELTHKSGRKSLYNAGNISRIYIADSNYCTTETVVTYTAGNTEYTISVKETYEQIKELVNNACSK